MCFKISYIIFQLIRGIQDVTNIYPEVTSLNDLFDKTQQFLDEMVDTVQRTGIKTQELSTKTFIEGAFSTTENYLFYEGVEFNGIPYIQSLNFVRDFINIFNN